MVNRATKRLMAKQQRQEQKATAAGEGRAAAAAAARDPELRKSLREGKRRTPPRQFVKEVRTELKKVAWPSRKEVATYTVVVLVSVIFVTALVFVLDYGVEHAIFKVYSS